MLLRPADAERHFYNGLGVHLGRVYKAAIVDDVKNHLNIPNLELYAGTGIDDLRTTFARTKIDYVIMGAGLDLETRLAIVREVFSLSESTTVHMKDVASGPEGLLPFVSRDPHGARWLTSSRLRSALMRSGVDAPEMRFVLSESASGARRGA